MVRGRDAPAPTSTITMATTDSIRWCCRRADLTLLMATACAVLCTRGVGVAAAPEPASPALHQVLADQGGHDTDDHQCCGPGLTMGHKRLCSDGSRIALECEVMFLLDKEENEADAYEVHADGILTLGNMSIHEFCVAHMPRGVPSNVSLREVAFVCYHSQTSQANDEPREQWWFDVASALSWVSVACLALTLAAHVLLHELRDLQGRCHMGAVTSLGLGLLVLAVVQSTSLGDDALCTTMAFLVYYWLMSAFFWLNVTSFNVWRSVVLEHVRFRERTLFAWYCVIGWGVPLLLLLLLLAAHLLPEGPEGVDADNGIVRPRFGTSKCWFHDDRATWAWFYWPLAVLLGMNIVYFLWTTARLWRQYGADGATNCRAKLLRRRFLLSLKLFLIMGISWTFELISSAADSPGHAAWYLTDTFNAMQGVVILIVLVVTRRRAWRALYRRRLCGLRPPERWAFPTGDMQERADACTSTDSEDDDEDPEHELKNMSTTPTATTPTTSKRNSVR